MTMSYHGWNLWQLLYSPRVLLALLDRAVAEGGKFSCLYVRGLLFACMTRLLYSVLSRGIL